MRSWGCNGQYICLREKVFIMKSMDSHDTLFQRKIRAYKFAACFIKYK